MFKFSLVGVLTAHGFHVKGHCLISGNMSPHVPRNSLCNFTAVCRRLSRKRLRRYTPSKKCTACSSAFFLLLKPVIYPPYFLYSN